MPRTLTSIAVATASLLVGGAVHAGTEFIPDLAEPATLGLHTTFQVRVREPAKFEVPALVTFEVTDSTLPTPQTEPSLIRATGIVLAPGHSLLIQIAAAASTFADARGESTYASSKVTWSHGTVTGGQGIAGVLAGPGDFRPLMVCHSGGLRESANLRFVLGADLEMHSAGTHTLVCSYRASSIL